MSDVQLQNGLKYNVFGGMPIIDLQFAFKQDAAYGKLVVG